MSDRTYTKVQAQHETVSGSSAKRSLVPDTCSCGQHTLAGGECSTCRSEQSTLLRAQRASGPPSAPVTVQGSAPAQEQGPSFSSAFDRASRFGHDFSQIPIHPPAAGVLQTKLTVNQPGDEYEQEADRIADQVMRMPEPQLQRACACGEACPTCQTEQPTQEYERLQTKHVQASDTGQIVAPPIVHEVLSAPGQPLDTATRAFMEQRFGYDFSRVRVHIGPAAEQSARDVNAHAYTAGHNMVFGAGRFAPGTHEGRRLIAHELTHVVQQDGADAMRASRSDEKRGLSPINLVQQGGGPSRTIQRAPDTEEKGDKAEGTPSVGGRVVRVVIATEDGVFTIETLSTDYLYELDQWNIPQGNYTASVSIKGKDVVFDFGKDFASFHFTYRINKGQDNPATLLKGQKSVPVDVVASYQIDPGAKPIQCLLPMNDQVLIDEFESSTPLFKPIKKQTTWFIGEVPLGFLGWIKVEMNAGLSLAGLLSYGYGPGVLSDICLYRTVGGGRLGGAARFTFGAAISPSVNAKGSLKAVAKYVSEVDLASAHGKLDASAVGRLSGKLDGRVDLSYDPRKNKWNFDTEALISGSASLKLTATASAAIELLYKEIWSKQWKLINEDFNIGWKGGLRIGTDTRPRFDFGSVGILSGADKDAPPGGPHLATATAPDPLTTEAKVDDQKMLAASINKDTGDPAKVPQGLSQNDALPIIWYKPLEIYEKTLLIPRALSPEKLDREKGPTLVTYRYARSTRTAEIGVKHSNWPYIGMRIKYLPLNPGNKKKDELRDEINQLLPEGETLRGNGFDLDHVIEKQVGGEDAYDNLWPADYQEQELAGGLLEKKFEKLQETVTGGSLAGRWLEIVKFKRASTVTD